ncbi:kirola-like isoform X2 [Rhododendron vialii]|uniref:kirola-like isoform X2 n=1 Tax=Rhododendron vialii TaxID=182163 RepID=UPI00265D909E|nr:kirola-like isoform X2 [Rhododendron vialii]
MAVILKCKLERQVEIKSDGDVFHELFRYKPHHISTISPANIHGVDLHEGDWGNVGSIITWNYTHDGKKKSAKEILEAVDEETKTVTFKVIEGDLTELYKDFKGTVHVDTKGESNLVTWTFEYEKLNDEVEDPNTLMDFTINVTKDIETHHLKEREREREREVIMWFVVADIYTTSTGVSASNNEGGVSVKVSK